MNSRELKSTRNTSWLLAWSCTSFIVSYKPIQCLMIWAAATQQEDNSKMYKDCRFLTQIISSHFKPSDSHIVLHVCRPMIEIQQRALICCLYRYRVLWLSPFYVRDRAKFVIGCWDHKAVIRWAGVNASQKKILTARKGTSKEHNFNIDSDIYMQEWSEYEIDNLRSVDQLKVWQSYLRQTLSLTIAHHIWTHADICKTLSTNWKF